MLYFRNKKYTIFFLIISLLLSNVYIPADGDTVKASSEHRGIWISYCDFEDAGLYDKSESEFTEAADRMFSLLKKYDFNNVYFHVRPYDDAIYPSDEFKWCKYISPEPTDYDPLDILIKKCHKYKLKFHAWINPYRITSDKIYDPGKQSTTDHIVNGVKEIIKNYNVDGIHFDDYFYPSAHKGNQLYEVPVENRMININYMVNSVYSAIKKYDKKILFGISPAGNVEYAESIGCDLETWFTEKGYVDYIIPQLYWSDNYRMGGKKVRYYTQTLEEWTDLNTKGIPMYIGLALYKAGTRRSEDPGWRLSNHNLSDHVKLLREYGCDGMVLFSYLYMFTPSGKKETASYIKLLSGLDIKTKTIKLSSGKKYNLAGKISVKKSFRKGFTYRSSNKRVATVTSSGIIKARKKGTARITVKGVAGSKAYCMVKVI